MLSFVFLSSFVFFSLSFSPSFPSLSSSFSPSLLLPPFLSLSHTPLSYLPVSSIPPPPPSLLSSTPAVKYNQRQNSGSTVCTLNEPSIPQTWMGNRITGAHMTIGYYDDETALKEPYQYMFQKVSEKALGESSLSGKCQTGCSLIPRPPPPSCLELVSSPDPSPEKRKEGLVF